MAQSGANFALRHSKRADDNDPVFDPVKCFAGPKMELFSIMAVCLSNVLRGGETRGKRADQFLCRSKSHRRCGGTCRVLCFLTDPFQEVILCHMRAMKTK